MTLLCIPPQTSLKFVRFGGGDRKPAIFVYLMVQHFICLALATVLSKMTTCLENLEMSGNLKHVTEMFGEKSCQGKVSQNCSLLVEYLRSTPFLFLLTSLADLYSHTFKFAVPASCFCLPLLFILH